MTRRDYFAGLSLRGLGRFDLTLQPTWSNSRVSDDRSQNNSQFRTDATILVRLLDEERQPGIPTTRFLGFSPAFVHVVFAYKRDTPDTGLDTLANYRWGAALNAKVFRRSQALDRHFHRTLRPTTAARPLCAACAARMR